MPSSSHLTRTVAQGSGPEAFSGTVAVSGGGSLSATGAKRAFSNVTPAGGGGVVVSTRAGRGGAAVVGAGGAVASVGAAARVGAATLTGGGALGATGTAWSEAAASSSAGTRPSRRDGVWYAPPPRPYPRRSGRVSCTGGGSISVTLVFAPAAVPVDALLALGAL